MLKVEEIREIIKLIDESEINEFVYEHEGSTLKLTKNIHTEVQAIPSVTGVAPQVRQAPQQVQEAPAQSSAPAESEVAQTNDRSDLHQIVSPMVGTFYAASSPDSDPYVKVGTSVSESSIVCIVEAMKLFNEIEAEVNGEIVEVLAKDGDLVEYGQPLFLVKQR